MNQVVTKSGNAVANVQKAPPEVLRSDIILPYVILAQGLSDAVQEKQVEQGDIYRSTSKEVVGGPDKPVDVIFLHAPVADWVIEQKPKGKDRFQYRGTEPRNASNETEPWSFWANDDGEEMEAGAPGATEWRRVKRLKVFAILPQDIEAAKVEMAKMEKGELPDVSKSLTPVVLAFRSSSYNTGKEIATFYAQAKDMKVPIWRYQIPLGNKLEKNDDGTFYVWKADRTKCKAVSPEHLEAIKSWVELISAGTQLATDEAAETGADAPAAQEVAPEKKAQRAKNAKEVC